MDRETSFGFESSLLSIEDPQVIAAIGKTHHANVTFNGNENSRVPGLVFEITDAELASIDECDFHISALPRCSHQGGKRGCRSQMVSSMLGVIDPMARMAATAGLCISATASEKL